MDDMKLYRMLADLQQQQLELANALKETVLLVKELNQNLGELAKLVVILAQTR